MSPQQIALERLAELGCDTLPKAIKDSIASSFASAAEAYFRKLARRHITSPKVARHFLDFLKQKKALQKNLWVNANRFDGGCAPPNPAPLAAAGVRGELG